MAVSASHAALPYPIKGARFSMLVPLLDADGDPTAQTTPDTEISEDNAAATDAAEEVSATSGMDGMGLITFTGAETDCTTLGVNFKASSGPKATLATLYPRVLAEVGTGTLSAGSAGGGTLGTILAYDVTGCFIKTTGGTGGGGTGGANNQARKIVTYTTSTGAFTVTPNWETTPDNTTTYAVLLPEGVTLGMLKALNPTTAGRTLDVSTDGEAGLDWANVGSPTTTVGLSGTTVATATNVTTVNGLAANVITAASIATDAIDADAIADNAINAAAIATGAITAAKFAAGAIDAAAIADGAIDAATFAAGAINAAAIASDAITDAKVASDVTIASVIGAVGSVTGNVGGNVTGSVGSVATGGITAASIADGAIDRATFAVDTGLQTVRSNTAQAGGATTITLDASASATDDIYNYHLILLTGGTGAGQARYITDYVGSTKVATVASWQTNPDATTTFAILPGGQIPGATAPTAGEVADAVWDEARSGHVTAGTFGEYAPANVTHFGGTAGTFSGGRAEVNASHAAGTAWGSGAITAGSIATGAITAAKFAAGAIDAAALAADAGTEIGTAVWATTTRILTALDEDTTTMDLDATIRAAVGMASANLDTQFDGVPTDIRTELATELARIDVATSTRMATYAQPTGFLAATFPATVASTTNITAGTITTATNVTTVNGLAAGVITAAAIATGAIDADALAADAVDEFWDEAIGDSTITARQAMRLFVAALAGKLSGAATTTVTIRNAADSSNVIVATVDADGNRSAVTLNP